MIDFVFGSCGLDAVFYEFTGIMNQGFSTNHNARTI